MKTIDVIANEWFDKVNGNSYFAGFISTDYGTNKAKTFTMPFQYGYGDQYIHEAGDVLNKAGLIQLETYPNGNRESLWRYCKRNNIILRTDKHEKCLKRELLAIK